MWNILFVGFIFLPCTLAKQYIPTPKAALYTTELFATLDGLAVDYDLKPLASFENDEVDMNTNEFPLVFFTAEHETVMKHRKVLSQFYEIEEDREIRLDYAKTKVHDVTEEGTAPWHLGRITQKHLPLAESYLYSKPGSCHTNRDLIIDSYIVDTGIDVRHPQFEGRAVWGANFADNQDTDCNSHGTHVAGLVGSKDYGVCVDANLYAVKVLDCRGSGALSNVIRGIEWAFKRHLEKSKKESKTVKSLINMSLGGGSSRALDLAVERCVKDNHFYVVVAAGNENDDACDGSPSGVKSIITVMASDKNDNKAFFSNWGKCTNIYAPGVDVLSTVPNGKTAAYSGTSMASPVMAGVLNHYLDMYPQHNQAQMLKIVKKLSTKKTIRGNPAGSPNNFVYLHRETEEEE